MILDILSKQFDAAFVADRVDEMFRLAGVIEKFCGLPCRVPHDATAGLTLDDAARCALGSRCLALLPRGVLRERQALLTQGSASF